MANERVIGVGAGGISNAWFGPLKLEGVRVAAIVELREEAARGQIEKYGLGDVAIHTELARALAEVKADFVLDLTTPGVHCEVTTKSLRAGFPVIGEKPMATTMDEARRMLEASEQTGKLYMVSQSRRWNTRHRTIATTLANRRIGDVTTLNCDFFLGAHFGGFRDEMPSPLILDMAIHHFDLARMFCGRNAVRVYAEEFNPKGSWYKGDVAANCLFEMEDGVRFAYRGSWCAEGCATSWHGDWRIIGDGGTLIYAGDRDPVGEAPVGAGGFIRPTKALGISPVPVEASEMHGGLCEMLRYLRTGQRPQTECHDNIHSLAMVLAAIESARSGKRITVADM